MNRLTLCVAVAAAVGLGMGAGSAHADSFMYHGSLQDAGKAANGHYDLQLTLYSAATGGHALSSPVTLYGVEVKDGNFVTPVDFGQTTAQTNQSYVQVQVKSAGSADFVALDQRSPVAPDGGCPGSWELDGNAAIPSGSYLGTADLNPVNFRVNGKSAGSFGDDGANNPSFSVYGKTSLAFSDGAGGKNSIAAGYHGHTVNEGSFDFSPQTGTIASVPDTATNQFIVNAPHGVGINTATAGDGLPLHDELTIAPSPDLPAGNADITLQTARIPGYVGFNMAAQPGGFFQLTGLFNNAGVLNYSTLMYVNFFSSGRANFAFNGANSDQPIRVGTNSSSGNGAFLSGAGVWTNASSRTFKDTLEKVDPLAVLNKLVAMPMNTWFYKDAHADGQHMGPIAEDFAETFKLGSNEKYIGTVDESGVALAAIQGLNHKVEADNLSLKKQNADLRSEMDVIAARLERLEHAKGE